MASVAYIDLPIGKTCFKGHEEDVGNTHINKLLCRHGTKQHAPGSYISVYLSLKFCPRVER